MEYMGRNYENESLSFINLLIFNYKDQYYYEYSNIFNSLSISHLFVVSGLHISVLSAIIRFVFRKKALIIIFGLPIILFVCYLSNFSIGVFRSLIFFCLSLSKNKFLCKNKIYISIIMIIMFCNRMVYTYSFLMTYTALFSIELINKYKFKNKIIKSLFITIIINVFMIPYISNLNGYISIFAPIFSYIFSPIVFIYYLVILIFSWIPGTQIVIDNYTFILNELFYFSNNINVIFYVNKISSYWIILYDLVWYIVFNFILRRFNNKIFKIK